MKFYLWTLSIYSVIATVLIVMLAMQNKQLKTAPPGRAPEPLDYSKTYDLPVGDSPIRGNVDAPVTIVAFSEFECPYCSKATALVDGIMEKHEGKVNLVFKNFPLAFHPAARPAAMAALAAKRQGKFWEMHDLLFQMQDNLKNQNNLPEESYMEYLREEFVNLAASLALDMDKFNADMDDQALVDQIDSEEALGRSVNVGGTPTFFVNGVKVPEPGQLEEVVKHFLAGQTSNKL
ncbi:MAG: DsbA family protein [Acidobacteriota bacterium]|nr:DsbA family protein [Acidobacteriota bacterium]